jgi:hypothetical protein
MPIYRLRKYVDANLTKAGGNAPDTAGVGVNSAAASSANTTVGAFTRTANQNALQYSADGSTLNTALDGIWTTKTITDGSATSLFDYAVPAGGAAVTGSGGVCFYQVEATDGVDFQTMAGMITYSAVNKAGTVTASAIGYATGNDSKSVSSGTLTLAWTNVTGTAKATVKLQPTGSLTETAPYRVTLFIVPFQGAVTLV